MNGFGTSPLELMAADAMLRGKVNCQNFTYSARWVGTQVLGANGTVSIETQINGDSDFIVQALNFVSFTAAGTILVDPDYTLLLTASGAGRNLMDAAQPITTICGSNQANRIPNALPFPLLLGAKNTLTSQLTNRTATASVFAVLSLVGFKVFYTGADRQQVFHAL